MDTREWSLIVIVYENISEKFSYKTKKDRKNKIRQLKWIIKKDAQFFVVDIGKGVVGLGVVVL